MDSENTEVYNPREDDNLGFLACFHRRYTLGDAQTHPYAGTLTIEEAKKIEDTDTCPIRFFDEPWEKAIVLRVFMLDHSGLKVSTSMFGCPWDSGRIGIIYAPYSKILKHFGWKKITAKRVEKVREVLIEEVNQYSLYIAN